MLQKNIWYASLQYGFEAVVEASILLDRRPVNEEFLLSVFLFYSFL